MNVDHHWPRLPAGRVKVIVVPAQQIVSHQIGDELPYIYMYMKASFIEQLSSLHIIL